MCIKEAEIIFEDFNIEKIVFSAYSIYDSNNVLIKHSEARTTDSKEYDNILRNTLNTYCYLLGMEELPDIDGKTHLACFDIDSGTGNYYLTLSFTKSIVQWDEYVGYAWYENEKYKKNDTY